jgi:hypothetical protein
MLHDLFLVAHPVARNASTRTAQARIPPPTAPTAASPVVIPLAGAAPDATSALTPPPSTAAPPAPTAPPAAPPTPAAAQQARLALLLHLWLVQASIPLFQHPAL